MPPRGRPAPPVPLRVGDRVLWRKEQEPGTVRFLGRTSFGGGLWVGIDLDRPAGKHDGAVSGVRYFACAPRHGIMVREMACASGEVGCAIQKTEERGITLSQLRCVGRHIQDRCLEEAWLATNPDSASAPLAPDTVNLYDLVERMVKPATQARQCSYVELVASGPQPPRWFVSHWWGEPVLQFIACLAQHSIDRGLGEGCTYWVCAYANNQWLLSGDVAANPSESSFRKAIALAEGTVSIMDSNAVCLTRIWCGYEVYASLTCGTEAPYKYDLYIAGRSGASAVGYTDGLTERDRDVGGSPQWEHKGGAWAYKAHRENSFPLDVARRALDIRLEDAQASCEHDRKHILNAIAGRDDLDADPLPDHPQYQWVNDALRWRLAMAMYPSAYGAGLLGGLGLHDIKEPEGWQQQALQVYHNLAETFERRGLYSAAADVQRKALAVRVAESGESHPDVAARYCYLASMMDEMGEFSRALEFYSKALDIEVAAFGERDAAVATTFSMMANVVQKQGDLARASELHSKVIDIQLEALGQGHPDVADSYNNWANVLLAQGDASQALVLHERALAIKVAVVGDKDPSLAISDNNLANVLQIQGDLSRALELHEKALAIKSAALGEQHPAVASSYSNMANVLHRQGDLARALELHEKALAIKVVVVGEQHPDVAGCYMNMANILQEQGELGRALELHEKALAITAAALGEEHPDTARTYSNMANVLQMRGDLGPALALQERALAIKVATVGERHPDVAMTYSSLASLSEQKGDLGRALALHKKALRNGSAALGEQHPQVLRARISACRVLRALGPQSDASRLERAWRAWRR